MAIVVIATTGAQAQAASAKTVSTPSMAFNGIGCNAIIVGIAGSIDNSSEVLVDTNSNTYTKIGTYSHSGVQAIDLWACMNPVVSINMVFTYTTSINSFPAIGVLGLSDLLNTTVDQTSGSPNISNPPNPNSPGSITPSLPNEIWISLAMDVSGVTGTTVTCSTGTIVFANGTTTAVAYGFGMAYSIQIAASAVNPSWTFPASNQVMTGIWSLESIPLFLDFQEIVIRDKRRVVNY